MNRLRGLRARFADMPVRTKLVLVFTVTMLLVGFINVYMQISINGMVSTIDKVYGSNTSLNEMLESLGSVQTSMYQYLNTRSSDALNEYYRSEQTYSSQIDGLNDRATDDAFRLTEKNIRNISEKYLALAASAVSAKRGRDVEQYRSLYEQASTLNGYLNTYINELNNARFKSNAEN